MSKRARLILILAVLIVCGVFLYPTFSWYFLTPQKLKNIAVESPDAIKTYAQDQAAQELDQLDKLAAKNALMPSQYSFLTDIAKQNYKMTGKAAPKQWTVAEVFRSIGSKAAVINALEATHRSQILALKTKSGKVLQLGLDLSGGLSVLLQADMASLTKKLGHPPTSQETNQAMQQAMEVLNNRIDKFGVTEPQIRRQGETQISVEIPGAPDPNRVYKYLQGPGSLSFHIVDDTATTKLDDYLKNNPLGLGPDLKPKDPSLVPAGDEVMGYYTKDQYGVDQLVRYMVIKSSVGLDGSHVQNAVVGTDSITGKPVINFTLDKQGGELFYQLTSANVGKTLAVILDGKVRAGATIEEAIRSNVQMRGFSLKDAQDLSIVLKTGALPVNLLVVSQQQVGSTLGEDSIKAGLSAIALSGILVLAFMLAYYKGGGINADIAQVLNIFIMLAILSAFNLTLTLTSIAGLILTVGMSVDANVIIFERIKEERRVGKSAEASIKAGFQKAFWTIMDSNVTTLIAAVFLSQLGTGPIQGFAYTLAVGIVSSMFTALVVSRLIFDFLTETLHRTTLSISWRLK